MNENDDLDLFFGTKSSYEQYKRKNDIRSSDEESDEEEVKKETRNISVLSKETLKPIDEETLTMLKRTRLAHEFNIVYMQSSLDFYDEYYNNEEVSEELKAARQIKRVYKVYSDYLNAIRVRNEYIDTLVEKYGGEYEFNRASMYGLITDWIPREPILSKKCPEYDMYLAGTIPTTCETLSDEEIQKVVDSYIEAVADKEPVISSGIMTSIGMANLYNEMREAEMERYGLNASYRSVTTNDLNKLNDVFNSWYKPDTGKTEMVLFKNAPENLQKRYEAERPINEPGLLAKYMRGEIEEELIDMNEMVYDEKTGRNMTRYDYENRKRIRMYADYGWSESRLRSYMTSSSKLGGMKRRKRVGKKRKRPSTEFIDDIMSSTGIDPIYSENEYIHDSFLDLMRGDD